MEKFNVEDEKSLDIFSNFVSKAKDAFTSLSDSIKENIKKYEKTIESTEKEISDTETSREKCEHEITKMEDKIDSIKDTIENVENTYKKMADAYASTSKGDTKDLYSEIIDGAKANCDKEVEKNRSEIARLNSDIEAIKNNIAEFTRMIDELNRDLENYNGELRKYKDAEAFMEKVQNSTVEGLEEIMDSTSKPKTVKKRVEPKEKKVSKEEPKEKKTKEEEKELVFEPVVEDDSLEVEDNSDEVVEPILNNFPPLEDLEPAFVVPDLVTKPEVPTAPSIVIPSEERKPAVTEETHKEEKTDSKDIDDSLQMIYDLTGYKPQKEETTVEETTEPKEKDTTVYSGNLESLFAGSNDMRPEPVKNEYPNDTVDAYNDNDMSEWEKILNGADNMFDIDIKDEAPVAKSDPIVIDSNVKKAIDDSNEETVDELLKPYGTTYKKLSSMISEKIEYKDGSAIPVSVSPEDVAKAINMIDGTDLRAMKTVGPEITIMRKVKQMKEGIR